MNSITKIPEKWRCNNCNKIFDRKDEAMWHAKVCKSKWKHRKYERILDNINKEG